MTKRVFLDTNHWITLTKIRIGIEDDPELLEIYNKIKKKVRYGTNNISIFSLSSTGFIKKQKN